MNIGFDAKWYFEGPISGKMVIKNILKNILYHDKHSIIPIFRYKDKDKVIVVVNVASQCGFTKQYDGMQKIWDLYQEKGIVMIGVPSNDFGNQEPGDNKEIKNFCESKFGITFPITEKTKVKGEDAHPFYKWARDNYGKEAIPKWNFHKIIIGKNVLDKLFCASLLLCKAIMFSFQFKKLFFLRK